MPYRYSDLSSLVNIVNKDMPNITGWSTSSKINVNARKYIAMLFHHRQKIINSDDNMVRIHNTVHFSISTNFICIHIDNDLTLNAHIKHINKNISKGVGVLLRLRIE